MYIKLRDSGAFNFNFKVLILDSYSLRKKSCVYFRRNMLHEFACKINPIHVLTL